MLFLTTRKIYISNKAGGGEIGTVIGTVQDIMTMNGVIIPVIRHGGEEYLMIGEIIIEIICGVVIPGILRKFIMLILTGIGEVIIGEIIMDGRDNRVISKASKVTCSRHSKAIYSRAFRVITSRDSKVISKASKVMCSRNSKIMYSRDSKVMYSRGNKAIYSRDNKVMYSRNSKVMYSRGNKVMYSRDSKDMYSRDNKVL